MDCKNREVFNYIGGSDDTYKTWIFRFAAGTGLFMNLNSDFGWDWYRFNSANLIVATDGKAYIKRLSGGSHYGYSYHDGCHHTVGHVGDIWNKGVVCSVGDCSYYWYCPFFTDHRLSKQKIKSIYFLPDGGRK